MKTIKNAVALVMGICALAATLPAQLQPPSLQATDHPDAVVITVTRFGPYPTSITHSTAPFVLCIVNRSGVLEETFSIVRGATAGGQNGSLTSLLDLHSTTAKQRDHAVIRALPGSYQLIFQYHANWIVNFTITAQSGTAQ